MHKPTRHLNTKSKSTHAHNAKNTIKATGSIRIIGGKHRGRKLAVLNAEGLRPTTDRVKETVFNWLMPYVLDSYCLDCFSGSGGLGFEAMSRGAKYVQLLELDKQAAKQLSNNISLLNTDNVSVIQTDCILHLAQTKPPEIPFDLVFIDPPFRQNLIEKTCELLQQGWLTNKALIYIEMEAENRSVKLPENWRLLKEKIAGQVAYRLYQLDE